MIWNNIKEWFNHHAEKNQLVSEFNLNAKHAFINGEVPTLLKAKTSWGNSKFKHASSDTWSGFRIKVTNKGTVNLEFCKIIGMLITQDQVLVRKLISCGFDTLEVFGMEGDGFQTGLTLLLSE
jgi:hypothetical protein